MRYHDGNLNKTGFIFSKYIIKKIGRQSPISRQSVIFNGGRFESFSVCLLSTHMSVWMWNTLENGEDSDENVYGVRMLFIKYP